MVGSRFYIFGGQHADSRFLGDLWNFDLQKRTAARLFRRYSVLMIVYSQGGHGVVDTGRVRCGRCRSAEADGAHLRHLWRLALHVRDLFRWNGMC